MESNRKRKGFMKGKLIPFYRSSKPITTNVNQYSSKVVKPSSQSTTSTTTYVIHHQDYVIAPPKQPQKVAFIVPAAADQNNHADKLSSQLDKLYGISADESVDIKAASYISSVQERFRLERSNSERVKCEDKK